MYQTFALMRLHVRYTSNLLISPLLFFFRGQYKTLNCLRADAEVMCLNALKFNIPGDDCWREAKGFYHRMLKVFEDSCPGVTKRSVASEEVERMLKAHGGKRRTVDDGGVGGDATVGVGVGASTERSRRIVSRTVKGKGQSTDAYADKVLNPTTCLEQRPFLLSVTDAYYLSTVDLCICCGSSGAPDQMLLCTDCGEVVHTFCNRSSSKSSTSTSTSITFLPESTLPSINKMTVERRLGWQCLDCRCCSTCKQRSLPGPKTNVGKRKSVESGETGPSRTGTGAAQSKGSQEVSIFMITCNICDRSHHESCIQPPLSDFNQEMGVTLDAAGHVAGLNFIWICPSCVQCRSCVQRVSATTEIGVALVPRSWGRNVEECIRCRRSRTIDTLRSTNLTQKVGLERPEAHAGHEVNALVSTQISTFTSASTDLEQIRSLTGKYPDSTRNSDHLMESVKDTDEHIQLVTSADMNPKIKVEEADAPIIRHVTDASTSNTMNSVANKLSIDLATIGGQENQLLAISGSQSAPLIATKSATELGTGMLPCRVEISKSIATPSPFVSISKHNSHSSSFFEGQVYTGKGTKPPLHAPDIERISTRQLFSSVLTGLVAFSCPIAAEDANLMFYFNQFTRLKRFPPHGTSSAPLYDTRVLVGGWIGDNSDEASEDFESDDDASSVVSDRIDDNDTNCDVGGDVDDISHSINQDNDDGIKEDEMVTVAEDETMMNEQVHIPLGELGTHSRSRRSNDDSEEKDSFYTGVTARPHTSPDVWFDPRFCVLCKGAQYDATAPVTEEAVTHYSLPERPPASSPAPDTSAGGRLIPSDLGEYVHVNCARWQKNVVEKDTILVDVDAEIER